MTPALSPGVQLWVIGLWVGLRNLVVGGFVFMAFELGGCWLFFFLTKVNSRPVAMGRGGREYTASPFTLAKDPEATAFAAIRLSCCSRHI